MKKFLVFVFLPSLFFSVSLACFSNHSGSADSIRKSWLDRRSSAGTAKIRFVKSTLSFRDSKCTPEEVREVFEDLRSPPGAEMVNEIVDRLIPELAARFKVVCL